MRKISVVISILLITVTPAFSGVLNGLYKTNPSEETGGYLHIEFDACPDNKDLSCGTIESAIRKDGTENKEYEHLNKLMVWNMKDNGSGKYKGGKIWDPSDKNEDGSKKIYNSKMAVKGDILRVDGCILFFCKGQDWKKID